MNSSASPPAVTDKMLDGQSIPPESLHNGRAIFRMIAHGGWLALSLLVGGLICTAWVVRALEADEATKMRLEYDAIARQIQIRIEDRLRVHEQILRSGAAFFADTDGVSREEWHEFAERQKINQKVPGIQGIGFVIQVPAGQLDAHQREIRAEGFPEYRVWPEDKREIYTSIIFLEPFIDRNLRAFGYDMYTEPVRRDAMVRARDDDQAALSGKVILVQETGHDVQFGALMYVPVYRMGEAYATVAERRAALIGWVYSPYRMTDLMEGILKQDPWLVQKHIRLQIHDGSTTDPSSLLYDSEPSGRELSALHSGWTHDVRFQCAGRCWLLSFARTDVEGSTGNVRTWLTVGAGVGLSLLLAGLALSLVNTRANARILAEHLTRDLHEASNRLSLATHAGGVGVWDYDVVHNRLVWDAQMFQLYGITPETFGGAYEAWQAGLHPDDRERGNMEIHLALQNIKNFDIEFRVLWPDGTIRNIRGFAIVNRDAAGKPLRMIGTNWDITAQKRAEEALIESETNFRVFFETMTDMILVGAPDGRILFANSAVTRILGYTSIELKGMHLLDTHPANKRQAAEKIFADMLRGELVRCPLPLEHKNGRLIPVETRVWSGKWNGLDCIFGICKDLSNVQEAEQRFEHLFRSNPCVCALTSIPDHRFVDVNDAFSQTLGYTRDEVLSNVSTEFCLFVQPERHAAAVAQLLREGRLTDFELLVRRKDGAVLNGVFSGEVINSQGRQYLLTVMVDTTERKHATEELARLTRIQSELLHVASDFVNVPEERRDAAIDESLATMGQLVGADRAYLMAYDFANGLMLNTHEWCMPGIPSQLVKQQTPSLAPIQDWVLRHQRGQVVHIADVAELAQSDPLRQWLVPQEIRSMIALPLISDGNCLGFVGFNAVRELRIWRVDEIALLRVLAELYANFETRGAMERKARELQRNLLEAHDAAQAAVVAKGLFLANMSHEIRTPLNAVLGYAQIMARECRNCESSRRLVPITRSGEHLLRLSSDLLDMARGDTKTITLVQRDFDFHQVLEDVRLIFVESLVDQGVRLHVVHAPEVPQWICADLTKVEQILINLVSNAAKFTTQGAIRVSTSLIERDATGGLMLAVDVEDTGCGISEDFLLRMFDVFAQADQSAPSSRGSGLGLPLSRRYAEALGGGISATSSVDKGSKFRFTFKARLVNAVRWESHSLEQVRCLAPHQAACRLLVVDDELENREMLAIMLTGIGFTVETVASAAQALERLRQANDVALVLIDKNMPEMSGYEAIPHLRALTGGKGRPILVVSASVIPEEGELARAAGADGYLTKPVRRGQLLQEISCLVGVHYEYEPGPHVALGAAAFDVEALAYLTAEQIQSLKLALVRGDILQLRRLIDDLFVERRDVGVKLGMWVDAYDYESLRRVLDEAASSPRQADR